MATAAILGLAPLYRARLADERIPLVVDAKVGSSAAGATRQVREAIIPTVVELCVRFSQLAIVIPPN